MLKNVVAAIPAELKTCKGMKVDVKAIEDWAQLFTNRAKLVAKITKNMALHHKAITADIATFKTDIKAKAYFKSGEDLADLLAVAVGTVESEKKMVEVADEIKVGDEVWSHDGSDFKVIKKEDDPDTFKIVEVWMQNPVVLKVGDGVFA